MSRNSEKQYKIKAATELRWNNAMDVKLKAMKEAEITIEDIAKYFKCKELIIHRRLRLLNLTETKWTTAQDHFLRQNYLKLNNRDMGQVLKVNEMYILDRLTYLGLVRKRGPKAKSKVK